MRTKKQLIAKLVSKKSVFQTWHDEDKLMLGHSRLDYVRSLLVENGFFALDPRYTRDFGKMKLDFINPTLKIAAVFSTPSVNNNTMDLTFKDIISLHDFRICKTGLNIYKVTAVSGDSLQFIKIGRISRQDKNKWENDKNIGVTIEIFPQSCFYSSTINTFRRGTVNFNWSL